MAERLAPTAVLAGSGIIGDHLDIDDDPDSPDGNWITSTGPSDNNVNTEGRATFDSPSATLDLGTDVQEFRIYVRRTNHTTSPSLVVELWEAGILVVEVLASTTINSTSGELHIINWSASALSDPSGVDVECRFVGTRGGGSPGGRSSLEYGALEWNATVTSGLPPGLRTQSLTGVGL